MEEIASGQRGQNHLRGVQEGQLRLLLLLLLLLVVVVVDHRW